MLRREVYVPKAVRKPEPYRVWKWTLFEWLCVTAFLTTVFSWLSGCAATKRSVKNMSVDVGAQYAGAPYPYSGITVPVGPINVSGGAWVGLDGSVGPYATVGYSWLPFAEEEPAQEGGEDAIQRRSTGSLRKSP